MTKYGNRKVIVDGYTFDSQKEANRFCELKMMMRATGKDKVVEIELQPKYELQEGFRDNEGKKHRAINYIADFKVTYADGRIEVEDVKGFKTEVFKLKEKMFRYKFPDITFKLT